MLFCRTSVVSALAVAVRSSSATVILNDRLVVLAFVAFVYGACVVSIFNPVSSFC